LALAQQRHEMESGLKENEDLADSVVSSPVAVVTPIAIYR
jgi:hypothetical protein